MKISVEELTTDGFAKFGTFVNPIGFRVNDQENIGYFPDQLVSTFSTSNLISVSILMLDYRELSINMAEKHDFTEEIFGGFQGDVVFHVALPLNDHPDPEEFSVFKLPAGSYVRLKRSVWHYAPFPVSKGRLQGIVVLPPYTFENDSQRIYFSEEVEIAL